MKRFLPLVILLIFAMLSISAADDITYWKFFDSKQTPNSVIMMFGSPSTIKTEELYSDWVKNQATGCGQLHTYAMIYSITAGDLNILKGPIGKASEASVVTENGKIVEVVWTYDNNQLAPALHEWINHKEFNTVVTKKPGVVMFGRWQPKKGTAMSVDCYTGGKGATCLGPIKVDYMLNIEE
jgi:hypothetical protein